MKRGLIFILILAVCGGLYCLGKSNPSPLQQAVADGSIIRLHIVAAGDDPKEQETKLVVRDAVLREYAHALNSAQSPDEMAGIIRQQLPSIEQTAQKAALSQGYKGAIQAQWGTFSFPDREYAGELVPAGDYPALRIIIGDGEGANWWCVMYPPLCYVGDKAVEPGDKVEVKFESSIAKWWKKMQAKGTKE